MLRRPPIAPRTVTLLRDTTAGRSDRARGERMHDPQPGHDAHRGEEIGHQRFDGDGDRHDRAPDMAQARRPGRRSKSCVVKVIRVCSIQLPHNSRATPTPNSLGTKARVNSWIWVIDWNSESVKPMTSEVTRTGALSCIATSLVFKENSMPAGSALARTEER